jgi:NADH-ubiquinone oxidoreductase chain 4
MLLFLLILVPLIGIFSIMLLDSNATSKIKITALYTSIINFLISLFIYIVFDYSNIDYQFVQEITELKGLNIYIGIDGISIYFILLTTLITPLVILSN